MPRGPTAPKDPPNDPDERTDAEVEVDEADGSDLAAEETEPRQRTSQDEGKWILLDLRARLLSIGSSLFHGQAPRSYVDATARRMLLPLVDGVLADQQAVDSVRQSRDRQVRLIVRPIIGRSGAVHGVLATYVDAQAEVPDPPKIGTWDWDAPRLRTYWDRELFEIYGFEPDSQDRQYWEAPDWFGLLDQGGYPQMREVLARFQSSPNEDLIIHMFRIARANDGKLTTLRLAGRPIFKGDSKPRWFRGVTMPVDGFQYEVEEQFREQSYIDAALQLATDPIMVMDLTDTRIYLTNAAWKNSMFTKPADSRLETVIHPDDFDQFASFLREAPPAPTQHPARTNARFVVDAGWREMSVTAVRLASGRRSSLYDDVMLLLTAPTGKEDADRDLAS